MTELSMLGMYGKEPYSLSYPYALDRLRDHLQYAVDEGRRVRFDYDGTRREVIPCMLTMKRPGGLLSRDAVTDQFKTYNLDKITGTVTFLSAGSADK